ncbi:ribonucleases P/MRP protein subunit POP1-domain-containing protein [Trichophaea hybrida]|nr:ribonucleases P/MRP protein subunit POP1-domain-containing protein [Trichophaea hybrida]
MNPPLQPAQSTQHPPSLPPPPTPTPNPLKRPLTTTPTRTDTPSSHERKRARILDSRKIIAQTDIPSLKSGSLDVTSFIKSRKFEISALQKAIATSKSALQQRAFQKVPRDLRRRTASHNVKRVPKRLRPRAKREMEEDNTPTHTFRRRKKSAHDRLRAETAKKLLKMGKKKEVVERLIRTEENVGGELKMPPRAHSRFRKRQRGKTWLPTHVWHAKRAHMAVRWRFSVAESPNEKSFRATQRAMEKYGGIAWDTSYWSSVLVRGEEELVGRVLEAVCNGAAGDKKVRMGKRTKECWAYQRGGYPIKPIAPVTVIWSPEEVEGSGSPRKVLVRVHPSAFFQVWEELRHAVADHNLAAGFQKVFIDDLRFELGSIKISGPSATNALLSVLTPTNPDGETEKVWARLVGLTNPAAIPPDVVFGFKISDPRLHVTPHPEPTHTSPEEQEQRLFAVQSTWPMPLTPYSLLDPRMRTVSVKFQASQKRIDKRKAAAGPGKSPEPIEQDPKIPIIILSSPITGNKAVAGNKAPGAWTIILPWKWVHLVWYALLRSNNNIRFGGITEQRQVAFDHGLTWFPTDFPGTEAGNIWEDEQARIRKEAWDKKPKQKRLNYDAVKISGKKGEVGEWNRCDWGILMTPEKEGEVVDDNMDIDNNVPTISSLLAPTPTQTLDSKSTTPLPQPEPPVIEKKWWHIPTPLISALLRTHPSLPSSLQDIPPSILRNGIFNVKITLLHRGSPPNVAGSIDSPPATLHGATSLQQSGMEKGRRNMRGEMVEWWRRGMKGIRSVRVRRIWSVGVGGIMYGAWFGGEKRGERLCVVRGVGETVGRLGVWEVV